MSKLALPGGALGRALTLGLIVAALQIPACMIGEVASARGAAHDEAAADIASHWGGCQDLSGPYLVVPYTVEERAADGKPVVRGAFQVFAPVTLDANVVATVEARRRGLYEVPVYRASARLRGRFDLAQAERAFEPRARINWPQAQLVVRLSDMRAIDSAGAVELQGQSYGFDPGGGALASIGLHAKVPGLHVGEPAEFDLQLDYRGSGALQLMPAGLDTQVTLKSNWPDPTFQGAWLPAQREIDAQGFTARWHVPYVARGLPASWIAGSIHDEEFSQARFGAGFVPPVDADRMAERSLKYSPLFTGLAFLLVWLFEVVAGARVHPVQYLFVGAALCLFYLLELSLAEHIGFGPAYVLAAAAVTAQVSLYSRSALAGRQWLGMGLATGTLYGLLYLLLREDDYALLAGSASLFIVLSAVMFLTRKVRWSEPSGEALASQ